MMFKRQKCVSHGGRVPTGAALLGVALSLGACLEAIPQASDPQTSRPLAVSSVGQALEPAKPAPRYVDYADAWQVSGCPQYDTHERTAKGQVWLGSWVGEPLFSRKGMEGRPRSRVEERTIGRLGGYCIFSWVARPDHPDAFRPFPGTTDNREITSLEDTQVVSSLEGLALLHPESAVNEQAVLEELRSVAKDHWDVDEHAYKLLAATKQPRARVAIIDNAPYGSRGEIAPKDAPHARAVTNVVRGIACPDGENSSRIPCSVRHSGHLALPLVAADQADWHHGGYFGTRAQVAVAIWDAVLSADQTTDAEDSRLILNLSIGWHADPRALSPVDLAVRDVLALARCKGHLAIAAAGNRAQIFDGEAGPLFPGAFENHPAPDPNTCAAWFDARSVATDKADLPYDPLVFAVGAVDQHDDPIRATRRAGRPPLAAYGFLVTTRDTMKDASSYPIAPMSGSSMAAAAVSGIAALVWAVAPDTSARGVMQLIYESGVNLSTERAKVLSDFPALGPSNKDHLEIHRVSMCRALMLAAGGSLSDCGATIGAFAGDIASMRFWRATPSEGSASDLSDSELATLRSAAAINTVHEPWAGPQPTSPGCSTCRLRNYSYLLLTTPEPSATLEVALTPAMQAQSTTVRMRLTTTSEDGEASTAILPPADQSASFTVSVPSKAPIETAVLTFEQDTPTGTVETYEQILVQ